MVFFKYTPGNWSEFDSDTQDKLNELVKKFGVVEVGQVQDSDDWCVRVRAAAPDGENYPLAALGGTALEAAQRLLRMIQIRDDDSV